MRAPLALLLAVSSMPALSLDVAIDRAERERRLGLLFATGTRSYFCDTPYRLKFLSGGGVGFESRQAVSWAPIVPIEQLLTARACMRDAAKRPACKGLSPLDCCLQTDAGARAIADDLHNWAPVDDAFTTRRKTARIGLEVTRGEPLCGGTWDAAGSLYLPRAALRGDVARVLLYFERAHGVRQDAAKRQRLIDWDMSDPADGEESARATRIDLLQGTHFGAPRRPLDALLRQERERLRGKFAPFDSKGIQAQLDKREYPFAYVTLASQLEQRLDAVALEIIDRKPGAWERAFEVLEIHDAAARAARMRSWVQLDGFAAKMFAFAVASASEDMVNWHAEWLYQFAPPGRAHYDTAYPAFILQMAQVVRQGRWPAEPELRRELGAYRGLFLPAADARVWHEAMNAAVNHYLEPELSRDPGPRLFAVEFTALTELRRKYAPAQYAGPVHALQLLPVAAVPAYRKGTASATAALQPIHRQFAYAPALPALHRAIVANDGAAFRAALDRTNVNQPDHLGHTPLLVAAEWNRGSMVMALRAAGARAAPDAGRVLINAAASGMRDTVRQLLAAGVDPNYTDPESQQGSAVLAALASQVDSQPIVSALLAAGATPQGEGKEADGAAEAESWRSWVWNAARESDATRFTTLMQQFKRAGMNVQRAGIICALVSGESGDLRRVDAAIKLGASVNEGADAGSAPIYCAIESGKLAAVKKLQAAGARLDVKNHDNQSPAAFADDQGMELIAHYLRQLSHKPR